MTPSTQSPGPFATAPSKQSPCGLFLRWTCTLHWRMSWVNSFKTIDGRGARVEIGYGPCIMVQGVSHVVIHGLSIHDSTPTHVGHRIGSDGDAISIISSSNIWVDHCSFSESYAGLVDVTHGSTALTISNNFFSNHDKVCDTMLLPFRV